VRSSLRRMDVTFTPISAFGLEASAELLTRAFADYLVKIPFTASALRQLGEVDSVNLAQSPVVRLDGEPAGAALIARRGAVSRLAGMALVPAARRRGVGHALMERLLTDARARGDRRMVLEVIEQNTAAVRLYENVGFVQRRRLVGFAGPAPASLAPVPALMPASLQEVGAAMTRLDRKLDWPWQISGETVARLPPPACGYTLDGAWVALLNPDAPVVGIRALAVDNPGPHGGSAVRLLHAVMARHPAKEWRISALWPEELAGWFTRAGLIRQELAQWQMVRELAGD
jgi:ribosomal protein S18 acetylase RimI-like enzyme